MTQPYHQPAHVRRAQILAAALKLAARHGLSNIKRDDVAEQAGVSAGSVNLYFKTMTQLRRDVMRYAVREAEKGNAEGLRVLAQGLAMRDRHAGKATPAARTAALATLTA